MFWTGSKGIVLGGPINKRAGSRRKGDCVASLSTYLGFGWRAQRARERSGETQIWAWLVVWLGRTRMHAADKQKQSVIGLGQTDGRTDGEKGRK